MERNSYEPLTRPVKGTVPERVEVRVEAERRRHWSIEAKLRIVRETLEPGVMAKAVAERHGISTGLLYTWRKQMLNTAMAGFVPVQVAAETPSPMLTATVESSAARESPPDAVLNGVIEVQWSSGVRVRAGNGVDAKLLRGVLAELDHR